MLFLLKLLAVIIIAAGAVFFASTNSSWPSFSLPDGPDKKLIGENLFPALSSLDSTSVSTSSLGSRGSVAAAVATSTASLKPKTPIVEEIDPASIKKKPLVFPKITPPVAISPCSSVECGAASTAVSSTSTLVTPPVATTTPVLPPAAPNVIDSQSIVGLSCYFKNKATGELVIFDKGSGVIIDPRGYILTSRHLVDLDFASMVESRFEEYALKFSFDHCAVGQVPIGATLPAPDLIQTINPFVQLPFLGYDASIFYMPSNAPVSDLERDQLDFAILKIDGVNAGGKSFGITGLPSSFSFARLAENDSLKEGDEVITYGYPGGISEGLKNAFDTLYLMGGIGRVSAILGGDRYFLNRPFIINTKMSVFSGRSGSPVFFQNQVVGIITAYREGDSSDSYSLSSSAIRAFLPFELR